MSRPGDPQRLLGGRAVAPFDILRAAHAELLVTDLPAARAFYVDQLGFVVTDESPRAVYLRGYEERHHHSLALTLADHAAVGHLAFLVAGEPDIDQAAAWYRERGCPVRTVEIGEEAGQGRAVRVQDPLGYVLEFYSEMARVERLLQRYDLYRGAGVQRLDHFNLHLPDVQEAFDLYFEGLGFRCSEYFTGDGEDTTLYAAWLFRKPTLHDVALTAGAGPRLHHVAYFVREAGSILKLCDELGASGWQHSIERGPGRHGAGNAFYLYLRDPDGHRLELYTSDYWTGDPDLEPIRWSASDDRRRSYWGHQVPERWYRESSLIQGLDGRLVPIREPAASELSVPVLPT
jgi:catechol 2,3-dioxygenase